MTDESHNEDREPRSAAPEAGTGAGRPGFSAMKAGLWAVVAVAVIALLLPLSLTATPRQCAFCHEMQPYYDSWNTSSHRAAASNCLYCHAKPGPFQMLAYEVGFYGEIVGHLAGSPVRTTAANAPAVESCLRSDCHTLNRLTSNSGDLKISHRVHVAERGIPCYRCHPGAVHTGVGGRKKLPAMKLCSGCHAKQMKSQCAYCHNEQRLPAAPPGSH